SAYGRPAFLGPRPWSRHDGWPRGPADRNHARRARTHGALAARPHAARARILPGAWLRTARKRPCRDYLASRPGTGRRRHPPLAFAGRGRRRVHAGIRAIAANAPTREAARGSEPLVGRDLLAASQDYPPRLV